MTDDMEKTQVRSFAPCRVFLCKLDLRGLCALEEALYVLQCCLCPQLRQPSKTDVRDSRFHLVCDRGVKVSVGSAHMHGPLSAHNTQSLNGEMKI